VFIFGITQRRERVTVSSFQSSFAEAYKLQYANIPYLLFSGLMGVKTFGSASLWPDYCASVAAAAMASSTFVARGRAMAGIRVRADIIAIVGATELNKAAWLLYNAATRRRADEFNSTRNAVASNYIGLKFSLAKVDMHIVSVTYNFTPSSLCQFGYRC
jgi:hypothetical protein